MAFSSNTALIAGTPSSQTTGTYNYTVTVNDTSSNTFTYGGTITVIESSTNSSTSCSISSSLINGQASQTVNAGEAIANIGYDITTDCQSLSANAYNLPPGVSMTFSNNIVNISGTTTASGTYNYDVTVAESSTTNSITLSGTITVNGGTTAADTTPPTISLVGSSTISVYTDQGPAAQWTDLGATATDDFDGDLTSAITIAITYIDSTNNEASSQAVYLQFPNVYTITYSVSDAAGNTDSIQRTVNVNAAVSNYNINVTASSNSDYTLSGSDRNGTVSGNDPSITINVGDEINFTVDAASHPFYIKTVQGTGTDNQVSNVTNNGATSGVVNWTRTAAGTYYYQGSAHDGMYGTITVQ
jgi:plastocyanin